MDIPEPDEVSEVILTWLKSVTQPWRDTRSPGKAVLLVDDEEMVRLITLVRIGIAAKHNREQERKS